MLLLYTLLTLICTTIWFALGIENSQVALIPSATGEFVLGDVNAGIASVCRFMNMLASDALLVGCYIYR